MKTKPINPYKYYPDRPNSYIIAYLMKHYHIETEEASRIMGVLPETFRTKLYRNSFSMEQFIRIMNVCCIKEDVDISSLVNVYDRAKEDKCDK